MEPEIGPNGAARVLDEHGNDGPGRAQSVGSGALLDGAAAHPMQNVAIASTFGLCCGLGAIAGAVSWPPVVFDWNAGARKSAEAELTPTPYDLGLGTSHLGA